MISHDDIKPIDAEVVALYERYNEASQEKTLAQMTEAMGILLYQMTGGDHGLIMEGIQRIGNTAVNIHVETMQ